MDSGATNAGNTKGQPLLNDAKVPMAISNGTQVLQSAGHGIFDNDNDDVVVSRTLRRICGRPKPALDIDDVRGY